LPAFFTSLTSEAQDHFVSLPIEAGAPSTNWAGVNCPTATSIETDVNHFDEWLMPAAKYDKPPEIGIPDPLCAKGHRGGSQPKTPAQPPGAPHGPPPSKGVEL